ncbi:Clp protease N-terminal domain-containing protein [Streptomyces sp. NL15-2K]|uniref:Clp protease N-terminal domain-containing protein n=1 Tax=Streptomyces sp. NL15-2K TaxID=376149 RepID=UPI000F55DEE8|nr:MULTISPECIES: Clp protease N-terminal domain-containing protein [Actinomycetes]WKX06083.1 Clp protease N-terminal domain-containing protein [Kutzneria buriramensis]GCB52737.1 ATP-dependent clp protease [Streptomyces sp. NL15-2K]
MFEFFTDHGKQAVTASQDEAIALGHDFIGTEHLLLGLLAADSGTAAGVLHGQNVDLERARQETVRVLEAAGIPVSKAQPARDALSSLGIDVAEIQRQADTSFGPGAFQFPRPIYTPEARTALTNTLSEARALGRDAFGTEHILLGLLTVPEGHALKVLASFRVDPTTLRETILAHATQEGP